MSNLSQVIDQISKEKGIKKQFVINSIVQGILTAARKKYGTYRDIEAKYNEETGEVELFEFKKVVPDEEFEDELIEIKYTEALALDPEVQLEDQIGARLEMKSLGRIDAQVVKQIIMQNLREAEHEIVFNEFEKRKGEIASGVVRRADDYNIVVELDKTEAYIPRREQIPGETYKSGERIQGYILEVRQTVKGPQIIMSRAHPKYLIKLFEAEVPEVYEGIVKIVDAAREPGQRAKMAVYSTDPAVHPVGACVGIKGSRVQNITQELKGERIDIIIWEEDPVKYICNAIAPAKIVRVLVDKENKQMQIIVPDDQLSLAIGKKGQNVRLAVKLTDWNLDLTSESQAAEKKRQALFNLCLLPDINETAAESIYQYGFASFQEIVRATAEDIQDIPGYEKKEAAEKLIQSSKNLLQKYKQEGKEIPTLPPEKTQKKSHSSSDLKEKAEEILKKELAQLSEKSTQKASPDEGKPEVSEVTSLNEEKPEASKETSSDEENIEVSEKDSSNEDKIEASEEVPSNEDKIEASEEVPSNEDKIEASEEVPSNEDKIEASEEVPSNEDKIEASEEVPFNEDKKPEVSKLKTDKEKDDVKEPAKTTKMKSNEKMKEKKAGNSESDEV